MSTYVYGGRFQGIQSYIFSTNRLKEIIGASELLNVVCSEEFLEKKLKRWGISGFKIIQAAASTLKIRFENVKDTEKMMLEFPMVARNLVPGIEYSQGYVVETENEDWNEKLEGILNMEKNRPSTLYYPNLMIVKRNNRTGLPERAEYGSEVVVGYENDDPESPKKEILDEMNLKKFRKAVPAHQEMSSKLQAADSQNEKEEDTDSENNEDSKGVKSEESKITEHELPLEIEKIANKSGFIAVVHADGNGLGQTIQKLDKKKLARFSKDLDDCTVNSARDAFKNIIKEKKLDDGASVYPFRPIVLGGDDFTFICSAEYAVDFTTEFIALFQKNTKEKRSGENGFPEDGLTACAGIAFVKKNYPLHYAYELAESLCGMAKEKAKLIKSELDKKTNKENPVPSCFAFMKELGSFAENFSEVKKRNEQFVFGPYTISKKLKDYNQKNSLLDDAELFKHILPEIQDLLDVKAVLEKENSFKTFLRNWMSEELAESGSADLLKERFIQVAKDKEVEDKDENKKEDEKPYDEFRVAMNKLLKDAKYDKELQLKNTEGVSPVLDILTLISIAEKEKNNEND